MTFHFGDLVLPADSCPVPDVFVDPFPYEAGTHHMLRGTDSSVCKVVYLTEEWVTVFFQCIGTETICGLVSVHCKLGPWKRDSLSI